MNLVVIEVDEDVCDDLEAVQGAADASGGSDAHYF